MTERVLNALYKIAADQYPPRLPAPSTADVRAYADNRVSTRMPSGVKNPNWQRLPNQTKRDYRNRNVNPGPVKQHALNRPAQLGDNLRGNLDDRANAIKELSR